MQRPLWGLAVALTPDTVYAPAPPGGAVAPAPTQVRAMPKPSPVQVPTGSTVYRSPATLPRVVVAKPKGWDRLTVQVVGACLLIVCAVVYWSRTHQVQTVPAPAIEPPSVPQTSLLAQTRQEAVPADLPAKKAADKPAPRRTRISAASAAPLSATPEASVEPLSTTLTRFREGL